jgi:hypothetical protein
LESSGVNLESSDVNLESSGDNLETSGDNLGTSGDNLGTSGVNLGTSGVNLETSGVNLRLSRIKMRTCSIHKTAVRAFTSGMPMVGRSHKEAINLLFFSCSDARTVIFFYRRWRRRKNVYLFLFAIHIYSHLALRFPFGTIFSRRHSFLVVRPYNLLNGYRLFATIPLHLDVFAYCRRQCGKSSAGAYESTATPMPADGCLFFTLPPARPLCHIAIS